MNAQLVAQVAGPGLGLNRREGPRPAPCKARWSNLPPAPVASEGTWPTPAAGLGKRLGELEYARVRRSAGQTFTGELRVSAADLAADAAAMGVSVVEAAANKA